MGTSTIINTASKIYADHSSRKITKMKEKVSSLNELYDDIVEADQVQRKRTKTTGTVLAKASHKHVKVDANVIRGE